MATTKLFYAHAGTNDVDSLLANGICTLTVDKLYEDIQKHAPQGSLWFYTVEVHPVKYEGDELEMYKEFKLVPLGYIAVSRLRTYHLNENGSLEQFGDDLYGRKALYEDEIGEHGQHRSDYIDICVNDFLRRDDNGSLVFVQGMLSWDLLTDSSLDYEPKVAVIHQFGDDEMQAKLDSLSDILVNLTEYVPDDNGH